CDPGEQAALSHAGQRIELEDVLVHALGEDHVDASWSAHVECLRGALRQVENTVEPGFADARGEVVFGLRRAILRAKIEELSVRDDLDRAEDLTVEERNRDLRTFDEALDEDTFIVEQRFFDSD